MRFFSTLVLGLSAVVSTLAAPTNSLALRSPGEVLDKRSTAPGTGKHNGFYYSFWTQNSGDAVTFTLGKGGKYTTKWSNTQDFVAGTGWMPGSAR
jgi:endo-1,4-beta-xylanase